MKADFGMVGLAVMGSNLSKNIVRNGFSLAAWDYLPELGEAFAREMRNEPKVTVYGELSDFVSGIARPRKIMLLIRAGSPVDQMMEKLLPLMDEGDVLIDGGNSNYEDTARRCQLAEKSGILYIGTGVSGGEEGALNGPSLMPGGSGAAWDKVKPIFQTICAHTAEGEPCCDWVGEGGAGHYVKMVHNGIEYGDMQLICEVYQLMRDYLRMTPPEMSTVFRGWNQGKLSSYLIGITADILACTDENGELVLDKILDTAGQKGTGRLTGINALNEGVPLTLITEAVFARCLSSQKEERMEASALIPKEIPPFSGNREEFLKDMEQALYASKICSYAQGYALLRSAAKTHGWNLNYGGIALMWRGGCIIRSAFLGKIKEAYERNPQLSNLLLDDAFRLEIVQALPAWRRVASAAIMSGIPAPAMTAALSWLDGTTTERLPANLLQAQRDYFGAHTYERTDRPRGEHYHTNWTGHGGDTLSSSYNA